MARFVQFLKDYAQVLQVMLTVAALLSTTAVAVLGYRIAEQQTQLLVLEHQPAISMRLDPSMSTDLQPAIVPFVVQNTNPAGPARDLEFQVLDFLEVDYVPLDDGRPDSSWFPGQGLALLPVGRLFWLEPTGAETEVLAQVRPIAADIPRQVGAVASELVQDDSDPYTIGAVHATAFVAVTYRDQLGARHTESFEVSPGPQGVRRISQERWLQGLAHWFGDQAQIIPATELTTTRVSEELRSQIET